MNCQIADHCDYSNLCQITWATLSDYHKSQSLSLWNHCMDTSNHWFTHTKRMVFQGEVNQRDLVFWFLDYKYSYTFAEGVCCIHPISQLVLRLVTARVSFYVCMHMCHRVWVCMRIIFRRVLDCNTSAIFRWGHIAGYPPAANDTCS